MNPDNEAVNAFDNWKMVIHPEGIPFPSDIAKSAWFHQQVKVDELKKRICVLESRLDIEGVKNQMREWTVDLEKDNDLMKAKIDRLEALLREAQDTLERFKEDFDTRMNLTFTNEDVLSLLEKFDQELGGKE